jgi:putative exosortase-associated protein (TIGR04073 family)
MSIVKSQFKVFILLGVVSLILTSSALAAGPYYEKSYVSRLTHKVVRGCSNVLFCWVEIPLEMNKEIRNTAPLPGTITGVGKGSWRTVKRLGYGVWDVVTCWTGKLDNYEKIVGTEFPGMELID